jgi:hypothetical protein
MDAEMLWSADARRLLQEMMRAGPPQSFKESAERAISREAERNASRRTSTLVEIEDVVKACLTVAPEPFRPKMLDDLRRLGIDPDEYSSDEVVD